MRQLILVVGAHVQLVCTHAEADEPVIALLDPVVEPPVVLAGLDEVGIEFERVDSKKGRTSRFGTPTKKVWAALSGAW